MEGIEEAHRQLDPTTAATQDLQQLLYKYKGCWTPQLGVAMYHVLAVFAAEQKAEQLAAAPSAC